MKKSFVSIHLNAYDNSSVMRSKTGGTPYWPRGKPYPKDMAFLAQINFEEVPATGVLPEKGMLQFFIKDDDVYGLDSGQNGYLAVYHETLEPAGEIHPHEAVFSPIIKPAVMEFRICDNPEAYDGNTDDEDGRLLGKPLFVQGDPRDEDSKYDTLLFQLDSGDFVMWGVFGLGNFFINSGKLKKCDFSDILYNWDC
jgi:uncharacterized protein YwqG